MRYFAISLLLLLGISAVMGGWSLMSDPTGKAMQIPADFLKGTPFTSYLIPGIILFWANGVLSLVIALLSIKKIKNHSWFILLQGGILIVWLSIQLIMNPAFFYPVMHSICYSFGILLMFVGYQLKTKNN